MAWQLILVAVGLRLTRGTPILAVPTATQAAALLYLIVVQTAIVFLAWYSAVDKLGVERAGLFNGVIPVATLAAVSAVGTGTVSGLQAAGAAAVAAGILVGLTGPRPSRWAMHARRGAWRPSRRVASANPWHRIGIHIHGVPVRWRVVNFIAFGMPGSLDLSGRSVPGTQQSSHLIEFTLLSRARQDLRLPDVSQGTQAQVPRASINACATFRPEYCCWPVISLPSRTTNALNSPPWT